MIFLWQKWSWLWIAFSGLIPLHSERDKNMTDVWGRFQAAIATVMQLGAKYRVRGEFPDRNMVLQPNLNGSHFKNEKPKTISHINIYSSSADISKLLRKSLFGAIQGSNLCLPESDPVFGEKSMEWHTKGPLATYLNPIDSPYSLQKLNFSGVTYSFTVKWSGVGCNITVISCSVKEKQSTCSNGQSNTSQSTSSCGPNWAKYMQQKWSKSSQEQPHILSAKHW